MSMRITNQMISSSVLTDLNDISTKLSATQEKLASGKQITKPSDDPYGTSRALTFRTSIAGTQQYERNIGEAVAWENITDSSLSTINNEVQRVRDLTVQGATDSSGQSARNAAADEIDQLIESVKEAANASYGGRYVFSGTATTTKPYAVGGPDTYNGDAGTIAREIGPGISVQINTLGSSLLGSGQGAADGKLLDVLRTISQDLRSGNTNALQNADLKNLDTNLDALSSARATVGATTNRLNAANDRLSQVEESSTQLLSNVEDADMAQTMVDFSTQQSVYQSALRAGANIVQQSLMDFLQ
jgi:flagellar hook-associated protein 3 FlgL